MYFSKFAILLASYVADDASSLEQQISSSQQQRLLFASEMSRGTLALYSMTATGNDKRLHMDWTIKGRGEYEGSVSPDGSMLAFTTYRYGGWKIAVSNIDGTGVRRLTQDPQYAYDAQWAPDGKSLIYRRIVNKGRAYFRGNGDIFRINLDGSGNKNISNSDAEHDRNPAFSPSGRHIAYDSFVGDDLKIFVMNVDGSAKRNVPGDVKYMFAPSWSPDGDWIAHLRSDERGYVDVWLVRKDGADARNLTFSERKGYKPASEDLHHWQYETSWSADGQTIAFVADYEETGNADIYTVSVGTGDITRLTDHEGLDIHPYWYSGN